ncbi:hypothetical protein ACFFX0_07990 [Citricoccus parietis]|uniref:Uncharacterized protein n=1 Tax=Citricoccus parietis TaxID=592307 RepID=A0ABV5FWT5_9MICC
MPATPLRRWRPSMRGPTSAGPRRPWPRPGMTTRRMHRGRPPDPWPAPSWATSRRGRSAPATPQATMSPRTPSRPHPAPQPSRRPHRERRRQHLPILRFPGVPEGRRPVAARGPADPPRGAEGGHRNLLGGPQHQAAGHVPQAPCPGRLPVHSGGSGQDPQEAPAAAGGRRDFRCGPGREHRRHPGRGSQVHRTAQCGPAAVDHQLSQLLDHASAQ